MRVPPTAFAILLVTTALTAGVATSTGVAHATDSGTCPTAAGAYAGGTGTSGDPFQIATPEQLQRLRDTSADWNDAVLLTADIDMGGCVWGTTLGDARVSPGHWEGVFDGGGHTISGLDLDLGDATYGGFIAYLKAGSITGVGFTGDVSLAPTDTGSTFGYVGGLVGFTLGVPISESFATGDVTLQITANADGAGDAQIIADAGGLVGYSQGDIFDAYATGDVSVVANATATGSGQASVSVSAGGLVSYKGSAAATSTYATGTVTSTASATGGNSQSKTENIGGFAGSQSAPATITNSAWNTTTSGESQAVGTGSASGISGLTTAQMEDFTTFGPAGLNWSITNGYSAGTTWSICPTHNSGFPFLSAFDTSTVCPEAVYARIDSIDVAGSASFVEISGELTPSAADDTIYVVDDSRVLTFPPLATGSATPSILNVGSPIAALVVSDDTIYVAADGFGLQFTGILSFPVGATGSPGPASSSVMAAEPTAIALGGQGTTSTGDDSVYAVAYNNANGIFQFTPSLDDSSFVAFPVSGVQPGAVQVSGADTTTTVDDSVYVRGNGGGSGAFIELTPALDDSLSRKPLGFGGIDFLLYDDSFLFSSYNLDRVAATTDLDDSVTVQFASGPAAVTSNGEWLGINSPTGLVGIGPVTELAKTSVLNLGYPFGYAASAAAASDRTFYVVGGGSVMSVVDKVSAGTMSPTSGSVGATVSLPFATGSGRLVDDSTVIGVSWGGTPVPVSRIAGQNRVEVAVPDIPGSSQVVLELNGDDTLVMGSFTVVGGPVPPAPVPATAPEGVFASGGDRQVTVTWQAPASSGSFPVSSYQVEGSPSGSCLIPAAALRCEVTGLVNGQEYVFRVRALTGAGWGAWSEPVSTIPVPPQPGPSETIVISGSRDGRQVRVEGVTTGLVGAQVTPWFRFPGPGGYAPGSGVRTVDDQGEFTWQRRSGKKIYVYFRADDEVRSNRVIIRR